MGKEKKDKCATVGGPVVGALQLIAALAMLAGGVYGMIDGCGTFAHVPLAATSGGLLVLIALITSCFMRVGKGAQIAIIVINVVGVIVAVIIVVDGFTGSGCEDKAYDLSHNYFMHTTTTEELTTNANGDVNTTVGNLIDTTATTIKYEEIECLFNVFGDVMKCQWNIANLDYESTKSTAQLIHLALAGVAIASVLLALAAVGVVVAIFVMKHRKRKQDDEEKKKKDKADKAKGTAAKEKSKPPAELMPPPDEGQNVAAETEAGVENVAPEDIQIGTQDPNVAIPETNAAVAVQPAAVEEQPAAVEQPPAATEEPPAAVKEPPAAVAMAEQPPVEEAAPKSEKKTPASPSPMRVDQQSPVVKDEKGGPTPTPTSSAPTLTSPGPTTPATGGSVLPTADSPSSSSSPPQ